MSEVIMLPVEAPYEKFLHTTDLPTWLECLRSYEHLNVESETLEFSSITDITQSLCIATYVQWLSRLCGELDYCKKAELAFSRNVEWTRANQQQIKPEDLKLIKATIAACTGHGAIARQIFKEIDQKVSLTVALMLNESSEQRAKNLKRYISDKQQGNYLPAVHFYAYALLDLGYVERVNSLLESLPEFADNSLLLDIRGKSLELCGCWQEAYDIYNKSNWVEHRYRKFICQIITRGAVSNISRTATQNEDNKLRQGMNKFDSEVDQTAIVRSLAFVNTCRWYNFDNWIVHFELGKLSFQRKRHAEAERHLKVAANQAPESFHFLIHNLRFINLTWLRDTDLPVLPEILESAHSALTASGEEDEKAHIRIYIATETGDRKIMHPVLKSENAVQKGEAYQGLQNIPEALSCWSKELEQTFNSRAYFKLIHYCVAYRFEHTVCYLVDVVKLESWESFFDLWELGIEILKITKNDRTFSMEKKLEQPLLQIMERIEVLCQFEFQHLIRALSFFIECERYDIAQTLLLQANKLAESPEEHLKVAVENRRVQKFSIATDDLIGLQNLLKAENESQNRLERLQIAVEYVRYGQSQRGRNILLEEGVLKQSRSLEPIEYIVALQCGQPCLSNEEFEALVKFAEENLKNAINSRRIMKFGKKFINRLKDVATDSTISITAQLQTDNNEYEEQSLWVSWENDLFQVQNADDPELEKLQLEQRIQELEDNRSLLFHRYTLWAYVINRFESLSETVMRAKPDIEASQTPIRKSSSIGLNDRAKQLSRLWRQYLLQKEQRETIKTYINEFYQQERLLDEQWDKAKKQKMAEPMRRLEYQADIAQKLLAIIREQELGDSHWPLFLDMKEYIYEDIKELSKQLSLNMKHYGMTVQS